MSTVPIPNTRTPEHASLRDAIDVVNNEILSTPDGISKIRKVKGLLGFVLRLVGALLK